MEKISEAVAYYAHPQQQQQQPSSSSSSSTAVAASSSAAVVMVFKERVLEAIDQLRRRKARPDLQRICNYLFRKYSIKLADARNALQWCCDTHAVRRVEYKGNISYRNATKKASSNSATKAGVAGVKQSSANSNNIAHNNIHIHNNHKIVEKRGKFGELLTETFGELIVFEPDYLDFGVPVDVLIDHILYKENGRYSRKYVTLLLQKEVATGNIIRMANGNYSIANNTVSKEIESQKNNSSCHSSNSIDGGTVSRSRSNTTTNELVRLKNRKKLSTNHKSAVVVGAVNRDKKNMENIYLDDKKIDSGLLRVGGRRKRAKKVFDPSDTHIPKKRGRPLSKPIHEKMNQDGRSNNSNQQITSSPTSSNANNLFKDGFRQSSQQSSSGAGVCCVCHNNNNSSKRNSSDSLIVCRECSNRAHVSCLNGDNNMMLKMYPDNTWQCPHCKTCCVCFETSNAGQLTICSVCADGYHSDCHQPPITDKIKSNTNDWVCYNCQASENIKIVADDDDSFNNKNADINSVAAAAADQQLTSGTSSPSSTISSTAKTSVKINTTIHMTTNNYQSPAVSPTPPQLSPQTNRPQSPSQMNFKATTVRNQNNNSNESLSNSDENDRDHLSEDSNNIPDATHWSPQQVAQYFAQYFPPEVTKVFVEQEIDGRSLLLLKRIDVLNNLNLKLGHAVKVYKHVVMLQVRRDDTNLYWL